MSAGGVAKMVVFQDAVDPPSEQRVFRPGNSAEPRQAINVRIGAGPANPRRLRLKA